MIMFLLIYALLSITSSTNSLISRPFRSLHMSSLTEAKIVTKRMTNHIPKSIWTQSAKNHSKLLEKLLYPPGSSLKQRMHQVATHPIYNFLHTYYRYSFLDIKRYSPGLFHYLEDANIIEHSELLSNRFIVFDDKGCYYNDFNSSIATNQNSKYGFSILSKNRDILEATTSRNPFYGCFGLHEWAMLYDKTTNDQNKRKRHQEQLSLRVSQQVINNMVQSGSLKCTHYDAFRFFHPDAKPMNIIDSNMTRGSQINYEQPGCIHANMDLFKYAYQLYPLIPSTLLIDSLNIAIKARKIDMRASPYDVSQFKGCEDVLDIETAEGRKKYAIEQELLYSEAKTIRSSLLDYYNIVLNKVQ